MKALSVLVKSLREQWRDIWTLLLTLASSPFFVLVYWMFFGGGSTTYGVLVLNRDAGTELPDGTVWNAGADIIRALKENVTYEDGQSMLDVEFASSRKDAEKQLKDREAAALLIIPEDFSRSLLDGEVESSMVTIVGDLTYTYYSIAAVLTNAALDGYLQSFSDQPRPVQVTEDALGGSGARTEFEMYVPGMMIFAVMMLIYQASMV
ncbi:MAG: ABC transporter permease, partial [Anaerolineae bacterium]|nr:ABC transporter permease [Anaerolineae bacterium]